MKDNCKVKNIFLSLLQDENVRRELKSVYEFMKSDTPQEQFLPTRVTATPLVQIPDDYWKLKAENEKLQGELDQQKSAYDDLKEKYDNKLKDYQEEMGKYIDLENNYNSLKKEYDNFFAQARQAFCSYQELVKDNENLKAYFHQADDLEAFICNASQSAILAPLWQMMAKAVTRQDNEIRILQALQTIFDCCLVLVNNAREINEHYERLNTSIGDEQDTRTQIFHDGPAQGVVQQVLLQGYRNKYKDNIEKKSLVILG